MLSPYIKRIFIDILLGVALIFGLIYTKDTFIDFLISLFHFNQIGTTNLNVASLAYLIERFMFIFIPLIMLTSIPKKKYFNKRNILKTMFITIGVCYFLGNTWVLAFLQKNNLSTLCNASIPAIFTSGELKETIIKATEMCYKFQYSNAYVFNTIVWNSYDIFGLIFSFVQGYLYIDLARNLETHRRFFMKKYIFITAISVLVPIVYTLLMSENHTYSTSSSYGIITWCNKNLFLIFESIIICVVLKISSSSKSFWTDILF